MQAYNLNAVDHNVHAVDHFVFVEQNNIIRLDSSWFIEGGNRL